MRRAKSKPIRVLVADPHPAARAGIRRALAIDRFVVSAEVGAADAAIDAALRERPDLCLVDVQIAGGGVAAAAAIRDRLPSTTVVMLAARLDEHELLDSLRAGADGYLLKDTDPARLPQILTGALSGEAVLPRKLAARVIEELRSHDGGRRLVLDRRGAVVLTAREWQVLEALGDRTATTEIAARFAVSPVTVRRHISHIVRKLRVADREAAIRLLESHRELSRTTRVHGAS